MEDNTSGFSLVFLLGFMAFVKESSLRILGWIFFFFFFLLSNVNGGNLGNKSPLSCIPFPMHSLSIFFF